MQPPNQRDALDELAGAYPYADRLPGWRFKVTFRSPGCFYAEGINAAGRKVGANGVELDSALESCVNVAMQHDLRAASRVKRGEA